MSLPPEFEKWLDELSVSGVRMDKPEILARHRLESRSTSGTGIRILTIVGMLLAAGLFALFLITLDVYEFPVVMIALGGLFVGAGALLHRLRQGEVAVSAGVTVYIMGYALLLTGLAALEAKLPVCCAVVLFAGTAALIVSRNYLISFLSVLVIVAALTALFTHLRWHAALVMLIWVLTVGVVMCYLEEARLITRLRSWTAWFDPVRLAVAVSLSVLVYAYPALRNWIFEGIVPEYVYFYVSVPVSLGVLLAVHRALKVLQVTGTGLKAGIFVLVVAALAAVSAAPAIGVSVLLILLSFYAGHTTVWILALLSLVYAVGQYYYDLHFTLLTKSVLLMITGAALLLCYRLIHEKPRPDAEE